LLASPRIRARQKEKARIMIGDKVPVIINSVTPIQTGSAVVTGTVQYLDVGIKLEVEPHVYAEGDVGIKLNLEVSNIVKEVRNLQSGTLAYQIGTRSAQTSLRLRDGESAILGGLISDLDRNTAAKVPGLGQLPVLGRLFSNHNSNAVKTEIILSITPRIVRSAATADASLRDVYSGTDATVRQVPLRLDPLGSASGASSPAGGVAPTGPRAGRPAIGRSTEPAAGRTGPVVSPPASDPTAPSGAKAPASGTDDSDDPPNAPATSPAPSPPADSTPTPTEPNKPKAVAPTVQRSRSDKPRSPTTANQPVKPDTQAPVTAQVAAAEVAPNPSPANRGAPAELTLNGPASVRVGEEFDVLLEATIHEPLRTLPLVIRFDPQVLSFVDARSEALAQAGGISDAAPEVDALTGRLDVELQAPADASMSGQGKLLNLRFAARNPRAQTRIALGQVTLPGSEGPRTIPRPRTLLLRVGQ
jgi:general secretion pathway protein D